MAIQTSRDVILGRLTAQSGEPFVVFLIGMRVNRPFAFSKWLEVFRAFPPMLKVLREHPEKGMLGGESFFRFPPLMPVLISYWRSFDDLERFARDKNDPHLQPWRNFNQKIGSDGSVGIWHETYLIEPGKYENVYVNMPPFGLAAATGKTTQPVGNLQTARGRIYSAEESHSIQSDEQS
jgi:hypothetical protein